MISYAIKHIVADHGPLSLIMQEVKRTPYSYTSKESEALEAAKGRHVYVIEVREEKSRRSYWLGYHYKSYEAFKLAGGSLWKGEFKYKNSAKPGEAADGAYFDAPVLIEDIALCEWLATKQPGMSVIPEHLVMILDRIVADPSNRAKRFT